MLSWLRKKFLSCERGSLGVAFAISLLPIAGAIGVTLDYSAATNAKMQLDAVTDAAALAAVGPSIINNSLSWEEQKKASATAAETYFKAQMAARSKLNGYIKGTSVTSETIDSTINVKFCYYASISTSFMRLLKVNSIDFNNCVKTSASPPIYTDVYVLVDASGSMGIGATAADQTLMNNKLGCAFACHTIDWAMPLYAPTCPGGWWSQTPSCAKQIGARTRFDVVRDSLATMIDSAKAKTQMANQFRFSINKFSNTLTTVQSLSSDLPAVKAAVTAMTMDQEGGTNFGYVMKDLVKTLPSSGDGKSPTTPKIFLLIMTDGVEGNVKEKCTVKNRIATCRFWGLEWDPDPNMTLNSPGFYSGAERSQVIDSAVCSPIKTNKVTILTLNTEYLTPAGATDGRFVKIKSDLGPTIKTKMAECASTVGMAYYATTPGEINLAIDAMFKSVASKAKVSF